MKILLLRHGGTKGNQEKRYLGTTEESLLPGERERLAGLSYPLPEGLYASPMKRCIETAALLFPGAMESKLQRVEDFRECDFGMFEYKNYQDLAGNQDYQAWINSYGRLPFPGGEDPAAFKQRCQAAFCKMVVGADLAGYGTIAAVIHGGTIMSIMEAYAKPHKDYFAWRPENGGGYEVETLGKGYEIKVLRSFETDL